MKPRQVKLMRRGMSILEVMMSMVVLVIALTATLAALQQGNVELRLGQHRQQKLMLAEAVLERERLINKDTFFTNNCPSVGCAAQPGTDITVAPVGAAPWVVDPLPASADPDDLSTGAYFNITTEGNITRATGIMANTPCDAVPPGTICREVLTHVGLPFGATNAAAALPGARVATTWVRVSRRLVAAQPPEVDVVLAQVTIQ